MADFKLKRIIAKNWTKFKYIDLTFPDSGLVLIRGVNAASGGALMSVGSGKTGLGEALARTLLGVQGRFAHYKQFSTDKKGDTYVCVEGSFRGKDLKVESGYRCPELSKTGEALRYTYDSKSVERARIDQTRDELSKLLGITPSLASWTVFVDGDNIRFNKLTQADSVDLVMSSLKQPPWNEYHESSKKVVGEYKKLLAGIEARHAAAASAVENTKFELQAATSALQKCIADFNAAKAAHQTRMDSLIQSLDAEKANAKNVRADIEKVKQELRLLEETRAVKAHDLEVRINDAADALRKLKSAQESKDSDRIDVIQKYNTAKQDYSNYLASASNCPTCNRPLGVLDQDRVGKLKAVLDKTNAEHTKFMHDWKVGAEAVKEADKAYRELVSQQARAADATKVKEISSRLDALDWRLTQSKNKSHSIEIAIEKEKIGPSTSEKEKAEVRVEMKKMDLEKAEAALNEIGPELAQYKTTLKVLEYWNVAFSPYGIPNMVLTNAVAPLNKEARRVSTALTGGTIEVRYSTVRELASGLSKAQLNIEVENRLGDKDLAGSSKGEAGLTNFIIAETLSEVGQVSKRIGFRWYDEVVPHQDSTVCHSIYSYMREVANKLGILIFLVDHNPAAANHADHVLVVEKVKEDSVYSTVYWK